jgi:hypothetical protein
MSANVLRLPLLPDVSTGSGPGDVVAPVDVEAAPDPDPVEVFLLVEESVGVFGDPEPDSPLVPEPLADEPDEFEEAGWAEAIP